MATEWERVHEFFEKQRKALQEQKSAFEQVCVCVCVFASLFVCSTCGWCLMYG